MEVQKETPQQEHIEYSVTDIHDICDKYVRRYFEHQKTDILANLRIFARHDREINYFMDRIMDELKIHLNKYKKEAIQEIKEKINEHIEKYDSKKNDAIYTIEKHLNKRIEDIHRKEPYDIISKSFLTKMENNLKIEYHDKVENLQIFCFLLVFINIGLGIYIAKFMKLF